MSDHITVTMPIKKAEECERAYPDSKYLAPALEKIRKDYLPDSFDAGWLCSFTGDIANNTVIKADTSGAAFIYNAGEKIWQGVTRRIPGYNGLDYTYGSASLYRVIYNPKPRPTEITFNIPIDEARKIGGCTVAPLVEAWDKANKKVWKVGDIVRGKPQYQEVAGNYTALLKDNTGRTIVLKGERVIMIDRFGCATTHDPIEFHDPREILWIQK